MEEGAGTKVEEERGVEISRDEAIGDSRERPFREDPREVLREKVSGDEVSMEEMVSSEEEVNSEMSIEDVEVSRKE